MLVREDVVSKERLKEIKRVKDIVEKRLKIRINFGDRFVEAEGENSLTISLFEDFIKAINAGFPLEDALKIVTEDYIIREIDVEMYSGKKKSHKRRIIGRIVGREGSAKRTIEEMTNTKIIVTDRIVYILGFPEDVSIAAEAVEEILSGRKHSTAYNKIRRKARWRKLERKYQTIHPV